MFVDDKSIKYKKQDDQVHFLSSICTNTETLKRNIIDQAASMLLQYVTFNKMFSHTTQNSNGNAFDEHNLSLNHILRNKKEFRRTDKCNSWLSKYSTKSETSLNRTPIPPVFLKSPLREQRSRGYSSPIHQQIPSVHFYPQPKHVNNEYDYAPSRFHSNQITLSANASDNINPQYESLSQPIIMVHKKRLRRDYFLSTMQNCIQPPYSQNHFYALDQMNMRKLQRNLHSTNHDIDEYHNKQNQRLNSYSNLKRKYPDVIDDDQSDCDCSEIRFNRTSPSKKRLDSPIERYSPRTVDDKIKSPSQIELSDELKSKNSQKQEQSENPTSHLILSRLEKILNLCGELRSLAKDVEPHAITTNEQKTSPDMKQIEKSESEQTIIDIYKELEIQQTVNDIEEQNAPPPYQGTNDTSSIHSDSDQSHQLMPTESFKTKSPSLTTSHTILRKSEDICLCFLKSVLQKDKFNSDNHDCQLNADEQEYLTELTRAYLLGREQTLQEQQQQEKKKFDDLVNETLSGKPRESDDTSSLVFDDNNNNNNRSVTPISPSSILFYNNFPKSDDHPSLISLKSNILTEEDAQNLSIPSGVTSVKHHMFINEPIAMKVPNVLPGIGIKYAHQLAECGFSTVRRLLGFYLMIKDDQHFVVWLNTKVGISIHSAWLCTNALRTWCQIHL